MRWSTMLALSVPLGIFACADGGEHTSPAPPDTSAVDTSAVLMVVYDSVFMKEAGYCNLPARELNQTPVFEVVYNGVVYRTAQVQYGPQGGIHRCYAQAATLSLARHGMVQLQVRATGYEPRDLTLPPSDVDSLTIEVPMVPLMPVMTAGWLFRSDSVRVHARIWDVHGWADARVDSVTGGHWSTLPPIPDSALVLSRLDDQTSVLEYTYPGVTLEPEWELNLYLSDQHGWKSEVRCWRMVAFDCDLKAVPPAP